MGNKRNVENMDAQSMVDLSADTVKFHPADIGGVLARNKDNCIDLIEQIENLDTKSWLVTAKICSDEEQPFNEFKWFKDGKELFRDKDWAKEVDSFRLNNDSASKALTEFAVGLYV